MTLNEPVADIGLHGESCPAVSTEGASLVVDAAAERGQVGLLSVVIPCYNEAKVLARTLDHLLPYLADGRLEILVSDDGSSDGTTEIARRAAVRLVEGGGRARSTSLARNRGAQAARGEILIFIDADILIEEPALFFEEVRRRFLSPKLLGATVNCHVYPEVEHLADRVYHRVYNEFTWLSNALGLGTAGGWCQIVRREAFFAIGQYDPAFTSGQDVDLFYRLRKRGRTRLFRNLSILESPRRYRAQGLLRTAVKWLINGVYVCFLRRPYMRRYPPIR